MHALHEYIEGGGGHGEVIERTLLKRPYISRARSNWKAMIIQRLPPAHALVFPGPQNFHIGSPTGVPVLDLNMGGGYSNKIKYHKNPNTCLF